jgi:hypothetical protein
MMNLETRTGLDLFLIKNFFDAHRAISRDERVCQAEVVGA